MTYIQGGQGEEFGELLMDLVKPFINEYYRTKE